MCCVILPIAATLGQAGHTGIDSAQQAAEALRPLAGDAAGLLFRLGMTGAGFLAMPVMATGAAYDLAQTYGWRHSLHASRREARTLYSAIGIFTLAAVSMNVAHINPMRALL